MGVRADDILKDNQLIPHGLQFRRLATSNRNSQICACVTKSSMAVISSQSRNRVSGRSAQAMQNRWSSPPESSVGYRSSQAGAMCSASSTSSSTGPPHTGSPQADQRIDGRLRVLPDQLHRAAPAETGERPAVQQGPARHGRSYPASSLHRWSFRGRWARATPPARRDVQSD